MSVALYVVENCIYLLIGQRIYSSELGMEVSAVFRDVANDIVYLIKQRYIFVIYVFNGNSANLEKWHIPVAVKASFRIYAHGKR